MSKIALTPKELYNYFSEFSRLFPGATMGDILQAIIANEANKIAIEANKIALLNMPPEKMVYFKGKPYLSVDHAKWAMFLQELDYNCLYGVKDTVPKTADILFPEHNATLILRPDTPIADIIEEAIALSKNSMVIIAQGPPEAKSYTAYSHGDEASNIIFVEQDHKFAPFYYSYDFDPDYVSYTANTIEVVNRVFSQTY